MVGKEGSKKTNTINITKKKKKKLKEYLCNDRVIVKEKGRETLYPQTWDRGEGMISKSATIVVGTMDSPSEEIVSGVA